MPILVMVGQVCYVWPDLPIFWVLVVKFRQINFPVFFVKLIFEFETFELEMHLLSTDGKHV